MAVTKAAAVVAVEVERTRQPGSAPSPGWPSPGLPPQEGLDGQGDAAAAVLLLALRALPLHHDGGSWESDCRTQRWLLSGCLLFLLLLPWFSPTLIPSFPEAEPALPAPCRVLLPSAPPPCVERGCGRRGGWRSGSKGAGVGGCPEELSASRLPAAPCFQHLPLWTAAVPSSPAAEESRGLVEQQCGVAKRIHPHISAPGFASFP